MSNLTLVLIVILVVLVYVIYSKSEHMDVSGKPSCNSNVVEEYQTNEVNYEGTDVESKYFNQLYRDMDRNERKYWLENQMLEQEMQQTHQCNL